MHALEFEIQTETGAYDLTAAVRYIGSDLLVAVWGGERPHIGAVAVAQPRPSLINPDRVSSSASVFCFLAHKEDDLAKATAEILSATLNTSVVVTAGIHWDKLSIDGIQTVVHNSATLVDMILEKVVRLKVGD